MKPERLHNRHAMLPGVLLDDPDLRTLVLTAGGHPDERCGSLPRLRSCADLSTCTLPGAPWTPNGSAVSERSILMSASTASGAL